MRLPSVLYLLNTVLKCPHEALFTFLIFILSAQLGATPFQLMILACLKPITSIFSFYTCAMMDHRPHKVRLYLVFNTLAGCLPSFLFPLIDHVWYYIVAYAFAMISIGATYPVWIEYIKKSDDREKMSKIISNGTSIEYGIIIFAPTLMAFCIDSSPYLWKLMFVAASLIKMSGIALIFCMKLDTFSSERKSTELTVYTLITGPFSKGWEILKKKPGFTHYLLIFFLGGAGIIGTQPILPLYFNQELKLSYTELALAFSFCKGMSFVISSPLWAKFVSRTSLYVVNGIMNLFTCVFFCLLLAADSSVFWLYPAYLFYGTMQAGCKLSWNLSGAVFSEEEESTFYSSMNLALVGIRGIICPYLGYFLFTLTNSATVFCIAITLCLIAILYAFWAERKTLSFQPA